MRDTDKILILFISGILLSCFLAALAAFRYLYKQQRKEHEVIIREQYRKELEIAMLLAGEQLHQNILNRQIRPIFGQLRTLQNSSSHKTKLAIGHIIENLEIVEKRIRDISNEIYPPHLNEMFIETCEYSIRSLAKSLHYEGEIAFDCVGEFDKIDVLLKFGLFSLIDLFVSNSLNHAESSKIKVVISNIANKIGLKMEDNGKGFDMNTNRNMDSRGLGDFRSRAIAIAISSSKFDYYSILEKGTFFEIEIKTDFRK